MRKIIKKKLCIILLLFIFVTLLFGCKSDNSDVNNETKIYVQPPPPEMVKEKPVIYIYLPDEIDLSVKIEPKNGFLCTYPKYNNGWKIRTKKDGTIICDSKEYNYLYWEGKDGRNIGFIPEYCIKGEETALFLEEKLEKLGLTRKEANEFIVYWLPRMEQNAYNLISFNTEEYCKNNPLSSNPQYETLIRVFMTFKGTDSYIEVNAPNIYTPKRDGLTIVEWGGMEIK